MTVIDLDMYPAILDEVDGSYFTSEDVKIQCALWGIVGPKVNCECGDTINTLYVSGNDCTIILGHDHNGEVSSIQKFIPMKDNAGNII